jgi:hypothetical protein
VRLGHRRVGYHRTAHKICYTTFSLTTTLSYAAVATYPSRAVLLFPSLFMVLFVFLPHWWVHRLHITCDTCPSLFTADRGNPAASLKVWFPKAACTPAPPYAGTAGR